MSEQEETFFDGEELKNFVEKTLGGKMPFILEKEDGIFKTRFLDWFGDRVDVKIHPPVEEWPDDYFVEFEKPNSEENIKIDNVMLGALLKTVNDALDFDEIEKD